MPTGRPRKFDPEVALERAMRVFWEKGFEGASLSDLTEAMGINRPSLYAAFGNKQQLFRKALERYSKGPAASNAAALRLPTAREVVAAILHGNIDLLTCEANPRGCMVVQSALVCGEEGEAVSRELAEKRRATETALRQRLKKAVAEGDLPEASDPAELARFVMTLAYGLSVQATSGAKSEELHRVADMALRAWPKAPARRAKA